MERKRARRVWWLLFLLAVSLEAQSPKIYSYVGRITADSFLVAWGTAEGKGNSIGRGSNSLRPAVVEADGRSFPAEHSNWVEVTGLDPDKEYPYRILIAGREAGRGQVRTFPKTAERLSFFLMGDFGTGQQPQYEIARAMAREFETRRTSANPVRFVLTTGDNIYYPSRVRGLLRAAPNGQDRDWRKKFFEPYEPLLRQIPFYPTIGNHERKNTAGNPDDEYLTTYLDNFFFPSNEPSPYYTFSFGGLADFFALDTTALWLHPLGVSLAEPGGQFQWLVDALSRARSPWKIAYFHHPPFTAGPSHEASFDVLAHVVKQFNNAGVQAVFSGHEHNFQFTGRNGNTGRTLYVVSGGGGQLRAGNIYSTMSKFGIAGWSPQRHFLLVEMERETLKVTPLSTEPVVVRDMHGRPIPMPLVVNRLN